jgi:molybdopterin synthase sulfur carrier subunit
MLETTAMQPVTFHYWAGAKAAAGRTVETVEAGSVGAALTIVSTQRSSPHFDRVIRASALLINGVTAHAEDLDLALEGPVEVEVLPPFAGGAVSVRVH